MNEMLPFGEKRMTVKEVAEALGVADRTIRDNVARLFPGLARDGIATMLDETQVTEIKIAIERSGRNDLANVRQVSLATTELEIAAMTEKVLDYWHDRVMILERELSEATPKIESHNALMRSELTMSITDAAKHFGLHPKTEVFPYLRAHNYLTREDLPSQSAIDAGYLALRQNPDRFGVCHPQAVVLTWMLENWRAHVVHQVKRWCGEIK
jgi:phage antirepressor YoqD-like protein